MVLKAFVVDDCQEIRDLVKMDLGELVGGCEIKEASSFVEAARLIPELKEWGCEVAVLDGAFPIWGDGEKLAHLLREGIPGILIVSHSGDLQEWGDVNIEKGGDLDGLINAVQRAVAKG